MKKPAKFNNYVAALMFGVGTYSEDLASNIFSSIFGLNDDEVDECSQYLDYVIDNDNLVEQKTCVMKGIKSGPIYDVFQCTNCGTEFAERNTEKNYIDYAFCKVCGAKVVE